MLATLGSGDLQGLCSTLIYHDGNIYGASGKLQGGLFFELELPSAKSGTWTRIILHVFPEGSTPAGNPTMDETGAMYGVTVNLAKPGHGGTVYRIVPRSGGGRAKVEESPRERNANARDCGVGVVRTLGSLRPPRVP